MKLDISNVMVEQYGPFLSALFCTMFFIGCVVLFMTLAYLVIIYLGSIIGGIVVSLFLMGLPYYFYRQALKLEEKE